MPRLQYLTMQLTVFAMLTLLPPDNCPAAPKSDLWARWQVHAEESTEVIDHSAWDLLLQKYVIPDHPSGINRFFYKRVSAGDRDVLEKYVHRLQQVRVSSLNREEQKAYWINLYNSLTVKIVLDHYPVETIRDIDISPGLFQDGPWDAKLLSIEGEPVSLNDIEHRILRPIWQDNRVHYGLNCASLGCPNLLPNAFTAENIEKMLDSSARQYVNHPRGVRVGKRLQVSSIYKWFQEDFGSTEQGVIDHLLLFADDELAAALKKKSKGLRYAYDWQLNE
jgi:hypothetical protein